VIGKVNRIAILLVTLFCIVGCDHVTKEIARSELVIGETISFFGDTLRLQHIENPGAFLGMGGALSSEIRQIIFLFGGTVVVGLALIWAFSSRNLNRFQTIGAALICGGGIGNMIDRYTQNGYVTDFLNLGFGNFRTGIFNVADFALLAGIAMVFFLATREESPEKIS